MDNLNKIKSIQSILVTSTRAYADNSSMASDLAVLVAQSGKKVALIDANPRNPIVHRAFDIPNWVGLCDVLLNHRSPLSIMHTCMEGNLSVMPSGKLPNGSIDLLCSAKMSAMLASVKQEFNKVFIQGPPFFYTETAHLAAQVDGVVLMIHPGYAKSETSRMIIKRLQKTGATIIGIVMRNQPKYQGNQSAFINRLLSYNKRPPTSY